MTTRIITVANQKGGVGKTTSTVNIAAVVARAGRDVLVVDLDPQGNASTALGADHREGTPSVYEVLSGETALVDVLQQCPELPACGRLPPPSTSPEQRSNSSRRWPASTG